MHTYIYMYICTLLLFEFVDTITLMDMDIDYSFYVAYASWPLWLLARLPLFFFFPISELPGSISQATQRWW